MKRPVREEIVKSLEIFFMIVLGLSLILDIGLIRCKNFKYLCSSYEEHDGYMRAENGEIDQHHQELLNMAMQQQQMQNPGAAAEMQFMMNNGAVGG